MKRATLCYIRRRTGLQTGACPGGAAAGRSAEAGSGWEYLLLFRNKKPNDPNEGKWIGVGGKFEAEETADECMLREVREETGLELKTYHFCGVIHFLSDVWEDEDMYLYRAEVDADTSVPQGDKGIITPGCEAGMLECDEGELRWVPEEQILELPMWEGDRLFLRPLLEGAERINMTLQYEGEQLVTFDVQEQTL